MSGLSEKFVASVAQALNAAHVPCVLWGHYLLTVHGVPSIIGSIDFVVPDPCLQMGAEVLAQFSNLASCSNAACLTSSPERPTPPPSFHVHIKSSEVTVSLFLQSETLWFLPPLDNRLLPAENLDLPPSFILASDTTVLPPWRPGRGSGVFTSTEIPVVVPKSHILLQAFLLLHARDAWNPARGFSISMIAYMEECVAADELLDANQLPELLRKLYMELMGGKTPVRQWTKELQRALGGVVT
ncbi:hypothetical protein QQX98_002098 [Neonectria punicea]|uniref:Thioredoxin reductase n=1 Tax=Neonectria punicea TaxID=979145 RepID=A0ABR1HKJ4_9HYPO